MQNKYSMCDRRTEQGTQSILLGIRNIHKNIYAYKLTDLTNKTECPPTWTSAAQNYVCCDLRDAL